MTQAPGKGIEPFSVVELFAGIGGFGLAFERAGFHVIDQVEIDPYCLAVLKKRFPDARRHSDVREVGAHNLPRPAVLCGGFPCQPHSVAGKRKGSEDSRDLWVEFARLIGELRPRWVVAENVPAVRTSDGGWYFWRVLADLAACGYDAEWDCIPASAVGANHQRDRIWIVAYPAGEREREQADEADTEPVERGARDESLDGGADVPYSVSVGWREGLTRSPASGVPLHTPGARQEVPDTTGDGRQSWEPEFSGVQGGPKSGRRSGSVPDTIRRGLEIGDGIRSNVPSEQSTTPAPSGNPRVPVPDTHIFSPERVAVARSECRNWEVEPDVGRVVDWTPRRVDRLRAIGNALVPQVAEIIAWRILEIEIELGSGL